MYKIEIPLSENALTKLSRKQIDELYHERIELVNDICIGYITNLQIEDAKLIGEFIPIEMLEQPIKQCASCHSKNIIYKHGKIYFCNDCNSYFNL